MIRVLQALTIAATSFFLYNSIDVQGQNFLGKDQVCYPRLIRTTFADGYGKGQNQLTITFQTYSPCLKNQIVVGQAGKEQVFQTVNPVHSLVNQKQFCHKSLCEIVNYDQYIHHVKVQIPHSGSYQYQIQGEVVSISEYVSLSQNGETSGVINAFLPEQKPHGQQKFLFFGDFDNTYLSQPTWNHLKAVQDSGVQHEAVIFLGDYGYEFWQNNGKQGDDFLQSLEPYSSRTPWLFTGGNHEDGLNFTFFNDKFRMPQYEQNLNFYYSVNIGKVHLVQLNLHFYNDGSDQQSKANKQQMRDWLIKDLQAVDRKVTPWVITFGHKSIYCSGSDCPDFPTTFHNFDDIFYQYGVDLMLAGHRHKYQMMKPMYNQKPYDYETNVAHTIKNPKATVYVIQGNGGNRNMEQVSYGSAAGWLLSEDGNTGVGQLTLIDDNTLLLEYIRSETHQVADYYYLEVDKHGPRS